MSTSEEEKFWIKKLKKNWKLLAVGIAVMIAAFIGAVIVMIRFIEVSPIGAQGTATLNDWNLDWVVGFIILITLWELLLIGAPLALIFGLGGYLWWRRLPAEEKQEYKDREKKDKKHRKEKYGGGGGGSLCIFIGYCIFHLIKGTYYIPFGDVFYSYWVFTWFETIMWFFIVLGIPAALILLIVYLTYWKKKTE
ncbi:MAG: hypothetical protein ACW98D_14280 [Promethearchaeota archaeon]|jgi:hypothetical protein